MSADEKSTSPITSGFAARRSSAVVSMITKLSDVTERRLTVSAGYASCTQCQLPPLRCRNPASAKPLAKRRQIDVAESFVGRKRQLERRALQMIHQNFQIVRLHVGMFGRAPEKIIRMLDDELIERRGRRHQHRARSSAAAPGASGALPGGSDRAGISGHHARRRASRYRCPARARSSPPRRGCALRASRARSRGARRADSRRDSRESAPACPGCGGFACCK